MAIERQTSWGRLIALAIFLEGTGVGVFSVSFVLGLIGGLKNLAVVGMTAGPILVILGLICMLLRAGSPLQSYRLFVGLSTSWMSRGGLMEVVFIILGLGYALPGFWYPSWLNSGTGLVLGSIAFILALASAIYHGAVLTEARAIPLWSSSIHPLLSLFTALCTGLGLLFLISSPYVLNGSSQVMKAINVMGILGIAFIAGELISIFSLAGTRSSTIYVESINRLRTPIFIEVIGLFFVLLLLILGFVIGETTYLTWTLPISGILLLISGFITRYSILQAGYSLPLRI